MLRWFLLLALIARSEPVDPFHTDREPVPAESAGVSRPYPPPRVVVLSYGRKTGDDALQAESFIGNLEKCGIEPTYLDDIPATALGDKLKEQKLPPGAVVLLNSHGHTKKSLDRADVSPPRGGRSDFYIGSRTLYGTFGENGWEDGDLIVSTIASTLVHPKIWVGTCHSGACGATQACHGAECGRDEFANSRMYGWRMVSQLICDSFKGDCSLWKKADPQGTGTIKPEALQKLLNTHPYDREMPVYVYAKPDAAAGAIEKELETATTSVAAECRMAKGTPEPGPIGYTWYLQYQIGAGNAQIDLKDGLREVSTLGKTADVIALVKKKYPSFPDDCSTPDEKRTQCSLNLRDAHRTLFCRGVIGPFPVFADGKDQTYQSKVHTFSLDSPRCGELIRKGAI